MNDEKTRTADDAAERVRAQYGEAVTAMKADAAEGDEPERLPRGLANAIILLEDLAAVDLWFREEAIRIATEPPGGRRYCHDFETDRWGNASVKWTWHGKTAVIDLDDFDEIVKDALHGVIKDFRNGEQTVFDTGTWGETIPEGTRVPVTVVTIRSVDEDGIPTLYEGDPELYTLDQLGDGTRIHIPGPPGSGPAAASLLEVGGRIERTMAWLIDEVESITTFIDGLPAKNRRMMFEIEPDEGLGRPGGRKTKRRDKHRGKVPYETIH